MIQVGFCYRFRPHRPLYPAQRDGQAVAVLRSLGESAWDVEFADKTRRTAYTSELYKLTGPNRATPEERKFWGLGDERTAAELAEDGARAVGLG